MRGMGEVQNPTLNMCQKMGDKIVPAAPSGTVADVRSVPASTGMQGVGRVHSMHDLARAKLIARLPLRASVSVALASCTAAPMRPSRSSLESAQQARLLRVGAAGVLVSPGQTVRWPRSLRRTAEARPSFFNRLKSRQLCCRVAPRVHAFVGGRKLTQQVQSPSL